ncbi:MAG: hypothetical protein AAF762_08610, partial [Pseudomonadota bacterium]
FDAAVEAECRIDPSLRQLDDIASRASWLELVDEGKATISQLIAGTKEALNDMSPRGSSYPSEAAYETRFLQEYENITGRSFWSDYPKPQAQLKAIRARGAIADNTEARLVQDRLSDADEKSGPKEKERLALEALFAAFGASELPTDD